MDKFQFKLPDVKFPDIGGLFREKFAPLRKEDEGNNLISMGTKQSSQQRSKNDSSDKLKAIHQLWYVEDNMTLVPMVCYKSKDAPETSIVLSGRKDSQGKYVWCVPSSGSYALSDIPPLSTKECTPLAGGLAWQVNMGKKPKRRVLRKLVVTGTTMALGAGILKGVQFASSNENFKGHIERIRQHFQKNDEPERIVAQSAFHEQDPFEPEPSL
eukprot:TRINITY_DN2433_c0_g2_i1.p1 TRINITY_DN2433_c0_g2~~TRINITY_DN2433_c0_g2_i1.p1  ORF type:complete len:213 (-),score=21.86 TRINITY_DN2433_c0_g2_i1:152-790(-)